MQDTSPIKGDISLLKGDKMPENLFSKFRDPAVNFYELKCQHKNVTTKTAPIYGEPHLREYTDCICDDCGEYL